MPTPHAPAGSSPRQLVSPRERMYYGAMLLLSVTVYAGLILAALSKPQVAATIITYGLLFSLIGLLAHGLALGRIRGNAVRVSERQFPLLQHLPRHMPVSSGSSRFQLSTLWNPVACSTRSPLASWGATS
jgi:O-antigen/teichoic acid export membrane protein